MYYVYLLQSLKNKRYYIGFTTNVRSRLNKHNSGGVKSTKGGRPWKLFLFESYPSKIEALKREREIKSYKGGIKFKKLIGVWPSPV